MLSKTPAAANVFALYPLSPRCALRALTLAVFCLVLAGFSPLRVPRAMGQNIIWDLAEDWNGQNPLDSNWSLSGGPTAHRWRGFESFGGDFSNHGCPHSFIVKCIGEATTQECTGSPSQVSLNTGEIAWHSDATITWSAHGFCGQVAIHATFQDHPGQNGITDLVVTKNNTELWRYRLNGGTATFAQTLGIQGTDQISFSIHGGPDGVAEDTVKITSLTITGTPTTIPTSAWTGGAGDGEWDTAGNWSPTGRPADHAGASFNLAGAQTVGIPSGRQVGGINVGAGTLNLVVADGVLSSPTNLCLPIGGSLLIGNEGATAGFSLFGEFLCDRLVGVGVGDTSQATLAVDAFGTLRVASGIVVAYGSGSTGIVNIDGHGRLIETSGPSISLARGDDSSGTINITNGGMLQYATGTPLKIGNGPGAHGTINLTGSFEGVSSLVPSGSSSQILLGAESPPPGGATTIGEINLHNRGLVRATEIRLGAEVRTRGTLTMDGGTLDVQSLIIADKGDGTFDRTGGDITNLRQITIGNTTGNSGRLDLDGPGRSLTLASPLGGETQNLYAGKTGRGRIFVTNGAAINLSSGSLGGLSIGATDPAGAGGVQIIGHDPNNPFFRSRIVGNAGSVLNVGRTYTVPLSIPALLIDDGARATFGSVLVGREDWMDGEIHVKHNSVLQQIRPGAEAFGSNDGLQIRGTPTGARLLVDTGGQVQCTSGIAFNTYLGTPVITVTGAGSTLYCSGTFYVAGDLPTGGKMRVDSGATMSSRDLCIARGGGIGLPGELTLSGPGQVLDVTGMLFIGVEGDPNALGKLILQNGAKVRTHRLALGANHSITTDVSGPPAILVGGSALLPPDIQCDTLMVGDTFDLPGLNITFGTDAGIGGHGTWAGSFDSTGEVVVPAAVIADGNSPMPRFTIDGNFVQHPPSVLDVAQTVARYYGEYPTPPIGSFLSINGAASISGTLRLTLWTIGMLHPELSLYPPGLIGETLPVLTAASVAGTFNAVEFGPGFPTNRVQLIYEPTQVLVTILPPVCDTSIQMQPTDTVACPEVDASFNIVAAGSDEFSSRAIYQWQHLIYLNDTIDWVPITDGFNDHQFGRLYSAAGANTSSMALTIDSAYSYEPTVPIRCIITNACGDIITSNTATLTVNSPPAISQQPDNAAACLSGDATFAITASGTAPFTYQWRKGGAPIDTIANPSATTATLALTNVQLPDADFYDCIVTNACGTITSNPATLTICIGDFNCDGGVDGADVGAFFEDWEAGNTIADVNSDGGVDGADVSTFFEHWEAGC